MLSSRLTAINGSMTFNWKFPDCPAIAMVQSLPIAWRKPWPPLPELPDSLFQA